MIFSETWQQVIDGTKTQTRRVIKPNEHCVLHLGWQAETHNQRVEYVEVRVKGRLKWQTGRMYSVQTGRGKPAIATIRITGLVIGKPPVYISEEEAKREGFNSKHDFVEAWVKLNGESSLHKDVWVITFELVEVLS